MKKNIKKSVFSILLASALIFQVSEPSYASEFEKSIAELEAIIQTIESEMDENVTDEKSLKDEVTVDDNLKEVNTNEIKEENIEKKSESEIIDSKEKEENKESENNLNTLKPKTLGAPINNIPNRLVTTFKGDTQSQMAFNWYTSDKFGDSQVIVSKNKDLSNAKVFKATPSPVDSMFYERDLNGRFLYRALKDGEIIGYFTDANVNHYLDLQSYAESLGADTYEYPERLYSTEYSNKALAVGLEAATTYYYKVGSPTAGYSEVGSFKTSGKVNEKFEFIQYTDTQNYWQNEKLFQEGKYGANTLETALKYTPNAKFVIHSGDIVETSTVEDEWIELLQESRSSLLRTILAPASGNHDEYGSATKKYNPETKEYEKIYDEADIYSFNEHFNVTTENDAIDGGSYYSYDYNGVHFLTLNTNDYKNEENKALGKEQLEWIRKDVEKARKNGAKWIILNYHKPIYSKSYHSNSDKDVLNVREEFMKLIDDLDIDLALQGHDHVISRTKSLKYATSEESPFNAKIAEEAKIKDGYDFYYNPTGTSFILPNTGGTKAYDDIYNKGIDHLRKVRPKVADFLDKEAEKRNTSAEELMKEWENLFAFGSQPSQPEIFKTSHSNQRDSIFQNYARYIVDGNTLKVELYQIEGLLGSSRIPKLVNSFEITKSSSKEKDKDKDIKNTDLKTNTKTNKAEDKKAPINKHSNPKTGISTSLSPLLVLLLATTSLFKLKKVNN